MKLSKEFIAIFREEAKKAQWEINCWNGKSIDDLVVDYLERKELKSEDFTGAVILTVEKAKEFEAMTYDFLETFESQFDVPEWNHYVKLHQLLEKRIKQVEGKE